MAKHAAKDTHPCMKCSRVFKSSHGLAIHMTRTHRQSPGRLTFKPGPEPELASNGTGAPVPPPAPAQTLAEELALLARIAADIAQLSGPARAWLVARLTEEAAP